MSSQYGELRPTSGWDRFGCLGHTSKFQWVSRLGFVTAATSLNGRKPNFARCLVISWAGTVYIHFRGLLPSCQVQNSLCVQVLRSPILSVLLHSSPVVASAKLCGMQQRARCIFSRAAITLGIGHILVCYNFSLRLHKISGSFPCSEKSPSIPGLWPLCWFNCWMANNVMTLPTVVKKVD